MIQMQIFEDLKNTYDFFLKIAFQQFRHLTAIKQHINLYCWLRGEMMPFVWGFWVQHYSHYYCMN